MPFSQPTISVSN